MFSEKLSREDLFPHKSETKTDVSSLADPGVSTDEYETRGSESYPLSPAQQRLWLLWKLEPEIPYCTCQLIAHFRGRIDPALLETSLKIVIDSNETIRARFIETEGHTMQTCQPFFESEILLEDISRLAPEDQLAWFKDLGLKVAGKSFNIEEESGIRVQLFRLSENEYNVFFTWHEIVADQKSVELLVGEVVEVYTALSEGKRAVNAKRSEFRHPEPAYNEHSVLEDYWKKKLDRELPILSLSFDFQRPSSFSYRAKSSQVTLDTRLVRDLKSTGEVSLFNKLLAAYAVLLYRYTAQKEIIVGTPVVNRNGSEEQKSKGNFVNMLPICISIADTFSFNDLLVQVSGSAHEGMAHCNYPFSQMMQHARVVRNSTTAPIFQTMFSQPALRD